MRLQSATFWRARPSAPIRWNSCRLRHWNKSLRSSKYRNNRQADGYASTTRRPHRVLSRRCDDWLHLAATGRANTMTRDQRRMRSRYVGPPADWSICNSHWLWAVDARVAEPSRRKSALPPGLFPFHSLRAGRAGISCRWICRIDCLGCDDGMVACRADRRRKMTHDPSSFRGRTCVGSSAPSIV